MTRPASINRIAASITVALLAIGIGAMPLGIRHASARQISNHEFRSVTLVIDYGQDVQKRFAMIPWKEGMTVADAMKRIADLPAPRGSTFEIVGTGERAFLKAIDGLANEGAGRDKSNWIFEVNDAMGTKSFGVTMLSPKDTISWEFRPYTTE